MTKQVQRRRGTATQHTSFTGAEGELSVNTTNKSVHVHDNVTAGGFEAARADMDNVTSSSILTAAGITATTAELNYVDGVTSNIQTQLDGKAGTASPTFTGTLTTANLTATGTTTLAGASTSADITFADNSKAIFGAGSDLQIYHDGSNSYIDEAGTGDLVVLSSTRVRFEGKTTGDTYMRLNENSSVQLYNDNTVRLTTTSTGIDVTGTVTADGVILGNNDILIFKDNGGVNRNILQFDTSNNIIVGGAGAGVNDITLKNNGAKDRLKVGVNGDISFYEDTGTTAKFFWDASAERLIIGDNTVTPQADAGDLVVGGSTGSNGITIGSSTSGTGSLRFADTGGTGRGIVLYDHSSDFMSFHASGGERMRITSDGNVGIGTSSPSAKLHVSGTYDTIFDGNSVQFTRAGPSYIQNNTAGGYTVFQQASGEAMRIDSSGNVGIGTTTPTGNANSNAVVLEVNSTGANPPEILAGGQNAEISIAGGAAASYLWSTGAYPLVMATNSTERMRIDSSGNLLVGKTSTSAAVAGVKIGGNFVEATTSGGAGLALRRLSNDGDMAVFQNSSGTTVGSIGAYSGDLYVVNAGGVGAGLRYNSGFPNILPCNGTGADRDNAIDLGASGVRFDDIYATNGTIQTSDRNEKQDIAELSDAEQRVAVAAKGLMRKFRWKDAVAEKGDEARTHFGIIAQDLQAAFAAEGLDAGDYAMFISSTWTDEETGEERTRMGVRYSELLAFIIGAL